MVNGVIIENIGAWRPFSSEELCLLVRQDSVWVRNCR